MAKYDIPVSQINIAGHTKAIRTGKAIEDRLQEGEYYGRCYHAKDELLVDSSLNKSHFSNTFIHEVMEAVNMEYCASKIKHREITCLSNGLHQALKSLGIQFIPRGGKRASSK